MIETLQRDYVNCWTLLTAKPATPEGDLLLRRVNELYKFPVDSMIFTPSAALVTSQNANVMAQHANRKAEQYHEFLTGALDKFRSNVSAGR